MSVELFPLRPKEMNTGEGFRTQKKRVLSSRLTGKYLPLARNTARKVTLQRGSRVVIILTLHLPPHFLLRCLNSQPQLEGLEWVRVCLLMWSIQVSILGREEGEEGGEQTHGTNGSYQNNKNL